MPCRNADAPGIDGTTLADVEHYDVKRLLEDLADDLRTGRWRPVPSRRMLIRIALKFA